MEVYDFTRRISAADSKHTLTQFGNHPPSRAGVYQRFRLLENLRLSRRIFFTVGETRCWFGARLLGKTRFSQGIRELPIGRSCDFSAIICREKPESVLPEVKTHTHSNSERARERGLSTIFQIAGIRNQRRGGFSRVHDEVVQNETRSVVGSRAKEKTKRSLGDRSCFTLKWNLFLKLYIYIIRY